MNCNICKNIIVIKKNDKPYNNNLHHLICNECVSSNNFMFISKTMCKNKYSLNDNDINNCKFVYFNNINNKKKLYLFNDIKNIIINKYGDINNIKTFIQQKNDKIKKKIEKKQSIIETKKKELTDILSRFKININNYGIHYEYINNKIPLDDVINYEKEKKLSIIKRKQKLVQELNKYGILFDDNNTEYQNYINKIGCKKLNDIVLECLEQTF